MGWGMYVSKAVPLRAALRVEGVEVIECFPLE